MGQGAEPLPLPHGDQACRTSWEQGRAAALERRVSRIMSPSSSRPAGRPPPTHPRLQLDRQLPELPLPPQVEARQHHAPLHPAPWLALQWPKVAECRCPRVGDGLAATSYVVDSGTSDILATAPDNLKVLRCFGPK